MRKEGGRGVMRHPRLQKRTSATQHSCTKDCAGAVTAACRIRHQCAGGTVPCGLRISCQAQALSVCSHTCSSCMAASRLASKLLSWSVSLLASDARLECRVSSSDCLTCSRDRYNHNMQTRPSTLIPADARLVSCSCHAPSWLGDVPSKVATRATAEYAGRP